MNIVDIKMKLVGVLLEIKWAQPVLMKIEVPNPNTFQKGAPVGIGVLTALYFRNFGEQDIDVRHAMSPFACLGLDVLNKIVSQRLMKPKQLNRWCCKNTK